MSSINNGAATAADSKRSSNGFKLTDTLYGLPIPMVLVLSAIILLAAYTNNLNMDYIGTIAFLMVVGGIPFYVGGKLPIVNDYLGGATVLPLFFASFLVMVGLVPEYVQDGVSGFMKGGFQNLYIAAVLVGSILSLNRKTMLSSVSRYIPTVLGSQFMAIIFLAIAGIITGMGAFDAIFMIGAPVMSGGSAGAIATLPAMYSDIMGIDASQYAGPFLGYCSIGNVISILSAAVLSKVLVNNTKINGNGRILIKDGSEDGMAEEKRPQSSANYAHLGAGLLISLVFMILGILINAIIPQIHELAWMIVLCIIAKTTGLLKEEYCDYANYWFQFMLRNLLPVLIAGIGITSFNIAILGEYFTLSAFLVIIIGIAGAFVGAMLFGKLFGLWPLEAGITAALCSCDVGGSGDIAILSASNRMQLLPFASISTRIGGALMILEIGLLMPLFVG